MVFYFIFRKDILMQYNAEKKKAIEYMAGIDSRVAITIDLWTLVIKREVIWPSQVISLMNLGLLEALS
jgi:hypothetical protein